MSGISITQGGNHYCSVCKLTFGALPESKDGKDIIRCPVCKQEISSFDSVTSLGGTTYRCNKCNLVFGKVAKEGETIQCPVCSANKAQIGG